MLTRKWWMVKLAYKTSNLHFFRLPTITWLAKWKQNDIILLLRPTILYSYSYPNLNDKWRKQHCCTLKTHYFQLHVQHDGDTAQRTTWHTCSLNPVWKAHQSSCLNLTNPTNKADQIRGWAGWVLCRKAVEFISKGCIAPNGIICNHFFPFFSFHNNNPINGELI